MEPDKTRSPVVSFEQQHQYTNTCKRANDEEGSDTSFWRSSTTMAAIQQQQQQRPFKYTEHSTASREQPVSPPQSPASSQLVMPSIASSAIQHSGATTDALLSAAYPNVIIPTTFCSATTLSTLRRRDDTQKLYNGIKQEEEDVRVPPLQAPPLARCRDQLSNASSKNPTAAHFSATTSLLHASPAAGAAISYSAESGINFNNSAEEANVVNGGDTTSAADTTTQNVTAAATSSSSCSSSSSSASSNSGDTNTQQSFLAADSSKNRRKQSYPTRCDDSDLLQQQQHNCSSKISTTDISGQKTANFAHNSGIAPTLLQRLGHVARAAFAGLPQFAADIPTSSFSEQQSTTLFKREEPFDFAAVNKLQVLPTSSSAITSLSTNTFCHICNRNLSTSTYLRTHLAVKHGIGQVPENYNKRGALRKEQKQQHRLTPLNSDTRPFPHATSALANDNITRQEERQQPADIPASQVPLSSLLEASQSVVAALNASSDDSELARRRANQRQRQRRRRARRAAAAAATTDGGGATSSTSSHSITTSSASCSSSSSSSSPAAVPTRGGSATSTHITKPTISSSTNPPAAVSVGSLQQPPPDVQALLHNLLAAHQRQQQQINSSATAQSSLVPITTAATNNNNNNNNNATPAQSSASLAFVAPLLRSLLTSMNPNVLASLLQQQQQQKVQQPSETALPATHSVTAASAGQALQTNLLLNHQAMPHRQQQRTSEPQALAGLHALLSAVAAASATQQQQQPCITSTAGGEGFMSSSSSSAVSTWAATGLPQLMLPAATTSAGNMKLPLEAFLERVRTLSAAANGQNINTAAAGGTPVGSLAAVLGSTAPSTAATYLQTEAKSPVVNLTTSTLSSTTTKHESAAMSNILDMNNSNVLPLQSNIPPHIWAQVHATAMLQAQQHLLMQQQQQMNAVVQQQQLLMPQQQQQQQRLPWLMPPFAVRPMHAEQHQVMLPPGIITSSSAANNINNNMLLQSPFNFPPPPSAQLPNNGMAFFSPPMRPLFEPLTDVQRFLFAQQQQQQQQHVSQLQPVVVSMGGGQNIGAPQIGELRRSESHESRSHPVVDSMKDNNFQFNLPPPRSSHQQQQQPPPPIFRCGECGLDFPAKPILDLHKLQAHGISFTLAADELQRNREDAPIENSRRSVAVTAASSSSSPTGGDDGEYGDESSVASVGNANDSHDNSGSDKKRRRSSAAKRSGGDPALKRVVNPFKVDLEAFCEICRNEVCSKYFLKTHKTNLHHIPPELQNTPERRAERDRVLEEMRREATAQAAAEQLQRVAALGHVDMSNPVQMASLAASLPPPPVMAHAAKNFCNICCKDLCNKYFASTHMRRMHNIIIEDEPGRRRRRGGGKKRRKVGGGGPNDDDTASDGAVVTDGGGVAMSMAADGAAGGGGEFSSQTGRASSVENGQLEYQHQAAQRQEAVFDNEVKNNILSSRTDSNDETTDTPDNVNVGWTALQSTAALSAAIAFPNFEQHQIHQDSERHSGLQLQPQAIATKISCSIAQDSAESLMPNCSGSSAHASDNNELLGGSLAGESRFVGEPSAAVETTQHAVLLNTEQQQQPILPDYVFYRQTVQESYAPHVQYWQQQPATTDGNAAVKPAALSATTTAIACDLVVRQSLERPHLSSSLPSSGGASNSTSDTDSNTITLATQQQEFILKLLSDAERDTTGSSCWIRPDGDNGGAELVSQLLPTLRALLAKSVNLPRQANDDNSTSLTIHLPTQLKFLKPVLASLLLVPSSSSDTTSGDGNSR